MDVVEHAIVSVILGMVLAAMTATPWIVIPCVIGGVLIDFDHFLLARYINGEWTGVSDVLAAPLEAIERGTETVEFEVKNMTSLRLASHMVIFTVSNIGMAGAVYYTSSVAVMGAYIGLVVGMLAHISCDVYVSDL